MSPYPYNPYFGQKIKGPGAGVAKMCFLANLRFVPEAADADAVMAPVALGAAVKSVSSGLNNPDCVRIVSIVGNVAGITGNVKVYGTDISGEAISETIALNGTTTVNSLQAYASVTQVDLPVRVHTPVKQVETATAAGTITAAGNAKATVTTALLAEAEVVTFAVALDDEAAEWAVKCRAALAANANVSAHFTVSGTGASVILTAKEFAANDATLNVALDNDTSEGITTAANSANTTAGVPEDTVSVGIGNSFGISHVVDNGAQLLVKLFDGSADTGTLTANATLSKNLFAINGTPDGEKELDLIYVVREIAE
jgi:hypothetical protein